MDGFWTGLEKFTTWCERDPFKALCIFGAGALALYIVLYLAIAGPRGAGPGFNDIYSSDECEKAYNEDYLLKDTPGSMTFEEYCENLNDTSYLDDYEPQ